MKKKDLLYKRIIRFIVNFAPSSYLLREYNIEDIFHTTIYWKPDITVTYDRCYERLKKESNCFTTYWTLHERAKKLTVQLLDITYENNFKSRKHDEEVPTWHRRSTKR